MGKLIYGTICGSAIASGALTTLSLILGLQLDETSWAIFAGNQLINALNSISMSSGPYSTNVLQMWDNIKTIILVVDFFFTAYPVIMIIANGWEILLCASLTFIGGALIIIGAMYAFSAAYYFALIFIMAGGLMALAIPDKNYRYRI